jgi:hypothetical protein
MNRWNLIALSSLLLFAASPMFGAPRDAASVLDHCGKPLKGDLTILESTVTGGRRLLEYERGTLHFDKVANIGWTFSYGTHGKLDHLTADQMQRYMPCLKDALANSAAAGQPLVVVTPIQRAEVSMKGMYKHIVLYTLGFLAAASVLFFGWPRRNRDTHGFDDEDPETA